MTLRHLQIFIKVYEKQSITLAAKEMHIAQPSVSLAIKEMENYYSIKFFDRMNRKIFPTQAAIQFYDYAIHIVSLFLEMEKGIKNWEEEGNIRIGSSITISHYILPEILQTLKQRYPNLNIKVYVHNFKTIEKLLLENKIDLGLVETNLENNNIVQLPFMHDHLSTIVPLKHPLLKKKKIKLEDLLDYPILMREQGSSVTNLVTSIFVSHQLPVRFAMESSSTQAIIKGVEANLGISTLPFLLVKQAIEEEKVKAISVDELNIERTYHVIYHKNKYLSYISKDFFEICKEFGHNYQSQQ
ncbi:MAG: LysR family transcriptional regulator [Coprobacillus cateniformis]|uniref:LysR substrate-binding domain-containing protein n=1 Tax=Longibaculum muris TaxID=1796628 RepID=UPI0029FEF9AB|nr:LysR family transcriptional regulator [Coprobacillus cateniformis]